MNLASYSPRFAGSGPKQLPLAAPTLAKNQILPFTRATPPSSFGFTPKVAKTQLGRISGFAASKLSKPSSLLGRISSAVGWISLAADLAETFLAPRWFDWLTKETGWRGFLPIEPGKNLSLPPGRYGLEVRGGFTQVAYSVFRGYNYDPPWVIWHSLNENQIKEVGVRGNLIGFSIYGQFFPLSGGRQVVYGEAYSLRLLFSDGSFADFDFRPRIDPSSLGPFYKGHDSLIKPAFSVRVVSSTNPAVAPETEIYRPAQPLRATPKISTRSNLAGFSAPSLPALNPISLPKIRKPRKTRFPTLVPEKGRPPGLDRPFGEVRKQPRILVPEGASAVEREILMGIQRLLDKECPDPCQNGNEEKQQHRQPSEPEIIPQVLLFWVEPGEQGFELKQGIFEAKIPGSVVSGIEKTAKNLYRVAATNPITAGSPEDDNPFREPIGEHLKLIWSPIGTTQKGYYYFRIPHWILGEAETLALDWSSLTWEKGLRNCLEVTFSTRKKLSIFGSSFPNLEDIFNFCLQGIQQGIGFSLRKIESSQSTSELLLKVKKLEFWRSRAGHPEWWSWWPPLLK